MKKIFILISAVYIAMCIPCFAKAAVIDSGNCGANGDNLTWTLDDNGTLTISGEGEMADYSIDDPREFAPWGRNEAIKTVNILDGVTSIGNCAFRGCGGIANAVLPNSITEVGAFAFQASGLVNITIPDNVTKIEERTFLNCGNLTDVTLSENITNIGISAFEECTNLVNINLPASITSIEDSAFSNCVGLENITLPANITSISSNSFNNTSIYNNPDNWSNDILYMNDYLITAKDNISGTRDIHLGTICIANGAFRNCNGLTGITMPESVKVVGASAFRECDGLMEIIMPENVEIIGSSAFNGCDGLTNIVVPNKVSKIREFTFANCKNLKSVTIGKSVSDISTWAFDENEGSVAFSQCNYLENIYVDEANTSYISTDGVLFDKRNMTLVKYPSKKSSAEYEMPDGMTGIGESAFFNCNNLKNVNIDGVINIADKAFSLSGLENINIPSSVTSIGNSIFLGCIDLESVNISSGITNISGTMFSGCTALKECVLAEGIENIGWHSFYGCKNLDKIMLPKSIKDIERGAFLSCDALKDVFYKGSIQALNTVYISGTDGAVMADETLLREVFNNATIHYNAIGTAAPIIADNMTAVKEDGTVKVSVPFESVEYDSHIITVALKGNTMSGVAFDTVSAGETEKTLIIDVDDADSVKIFAWDSLNGMRPLCEAKTVTVE